MLDSHMFANKINVVLLELVQSVIGESDIKTFTTKVNLTVNQVDIENTCCISKTKTPKIPLSRSYMAMMELPGGARP